MFTIDDPLTTRVDEHDFAAAWHACTARDPDHRGDAAADLAFWHDHARGYDEQSRAPERYTQTLALLNSLVSTNDFVLDVGAGTGRFAIPLAKKVRRVTALDHAAPMLDVLRDHLTREHIENVSLVEAAWEDATIAPHDVVLAAWSLYRLPDILAGMRKLIAATKRTLVIVASPGHSLRHDPVLAPIWGHLDNTDTPLHLYFYGVLWQAGIHAELRTVTEYQPIYGRTPGNIALQLAPSEATQAEIHTFIETLTPHLHHTEDGYCYQRALPVGVIIWHRPPTDTGKLS